MTTDQDIPRPPPLDLHPNIPPLLETAARAGSRRADMRNRFSGMIAGLAVAGILMGGSFWMGFQTGTKNITGADIPLIRAVIGPAKVAPEDPGGLQVPNQDKLVFEGVRENVDEAAETVAPPPEEPAPPAPSNLPRITETDRASEPAQNSEPRRPIVVEGRDIASETVVAETGVAEAGVSEDVDPNESAATEDAVPTDASSSPSDDGPTVVAVVEVEQTPPSAPVVEAAAPKPIVLAPPPAPAPPAPTPTSTASTATETVVAVISATRIQVGAYRSLNAAMQGWRIIQTAHADLLTGLEPTVIGVDLGTGRGIFHRLQAGPLADVASANRLCESLRALKQGCLVVRP